MSGRKDIGFSIYIELPTQVVVTPSVQNIVNNFDLQGDIVTLPRLLGESNVDYKKRIWDVSVHRGGPEYEGVVNNLTRDLGFLRSPALKIELKYTSGGDRAAPNPRVDFLSNRVVLYSDWRPIGTPVIDREIRTYQLGDDGYYLNNLVAKINESPYFSATILSGTRSNTISSTLVRRTSDYFIISQNIRSDKLTKLDFDIIIQDSMSFSETDTFKTEVTGTPSLEGEYKIDYQTGEVLTYNLPSGVGTCSYRTGLFPMEVDISPIQLFTLQDDDFQNELFLKRTLASGEEINALPNTEGAEIFHQVFLDADVFWGQ
jgi:hypothetical protein